MYKSPFGTGPRMERPKGRGRETSDAKAGEGSAVTAKIAGSASVDTLPDSGRWYVQEATTQQSAGPWTVAQLRARWRRNQVNGRTLVWRDGLEGGWKPLIDVDELKHAFRAIEQEGGQEEEGLTVKCLRRAHVARTPIHI